MAFHRLDLLASLQALFTVPGGGTTNGYWVGDAGGSTGTSQTGPGSNNQDGFVFSESSASVDFPDQLIENSTIVALPAIMGAWAGPGRLLRLRACIAGASWLDIGEGLQIQGRASDADAWGLVALIQGWGFSNNYQQGNNIEDAGGDFLTCALNGGWVDFEFPFDDTYTQLRIRSLPTDVGGGFTYRHDAALYSIDFVDGGVAPPDPLILPAVVNQAAVVGTAYSQTLPVATGGSPPYTYAIGGNIPDGLAFNANTRRITGTPTAAGVVVVTYSATDDDGTVATSQFSIIVLAAVPDPLILPAVVNQAAVVGTAYSQTLPVATGGSPPYTYAIGGNIPDGLAFNANTRRITGTPTAAGVGVVTYSATDDDGTVATSQFSITVAPAAVPDLSVPAIGNQAAVVGTAYSQTLPVATGGVPPYAYFIIGNLPDGLAFDANAREISGTPTTVGSEPIVYRVIDDDGDAVTSQFNIIVSAADLSPSLPDLADIEIEQNQPFSLVLPVATGGNPPLTYSRRGGIPAGLSFNANTREISGTPTTIQSRNFRYRVTDSDGDADESAFQIDVIVGDLTPVLPVIADVSYNQGEVVSLVLPEATSGDQPITYSASGLPPGFSFDVMDRELSGIAFNPGSFIITYIASDVDGDTGIASFTLTVTGFDTTEVSGSLPFPEMYFDSGVFPCVEKHPIDLGLRGRIVGLFVNKSFNYVNPAVFDVFVEGNYSVTGIEFRDGRIVFQGDDIDDLGGFFGWVLFRVDGRFLYFNLGVEGDRLVAIDENNSMLDAIDGIDGEVSIAIVDRSKSYLSEPNRPLLFFRVDGSQLSLDDVFLKCRTSKGIHSLDPLNRVADIGEMSFNIRVAVGSWQEDQSSVVVGATLITQRSSIVSFGIYEGENEHILWTGRVEEIKKTEEAGRNQLVLEIVARDKILELSEVHFPVRSTRSGWNYTNPARGGSAVLEPGDIVIPAGQTGSIDDERVMVRSSLRYAFKNIADHVAEIRDGDFVSWTESEHRKYIGVDNEEDATVLSFFRDVINSEYGMMWADRDNRIRTLGREFWHSLGGADGRTVPVISDSQLRNASILGVGELNYSNIKIKSNTYEEISRFRPTETNRRGTFAADDESVFYRSIDFSLEDSNDPPYVIGSGISTVIEIRMEAITRDSFHGIVEEGRTEIFQNLSSYWKDYNDGQKFVGIIPMRALTDSSGDDDTEIQIDVSDIAGLSVGSVIVPDDNEDGLRYGGVKSWRAGAVMATAYYDQKTLVISFENDSDRRVAITRIVALGRMIKLVRVNDLNTQFPSVSRENNLVYNAKYVNNNRNGLGGVGNEALDISNLIALKYNDKKRWPSRVEIDITRNAVAFRNAISSTIGTVAIIDSFVNDFRVRGVVVAEDWEVDWPSVRKIVTFAPVSDIIEEIDPSAIYATGNSIPIAPYGATIRKRSPDSNLIVWNTPYIVRGSSISGYTIQAKRRTSNAWVVVASDVEPNDFYTHVDVDIDEFHYRVRANSVTGSSEYSNPFPNIDASNLPPTVASSLPDISIYRGSSRTVSYADIFSDPDGDAITFTAESSHENIATVTIDIAAMTVRVVAVGNGTAVIAILAMDAVETARLEFSVRVSTRPAPPPPPPPPPPDDPVEPPPPPPDPCDGASNPSQVGGIGVNYEGVFGNWKRYTVSSNWRINTSGVSYVVTYRMPWEYSDDSDSGTATASDSEPSGSSGSVRHSSAIIQIPNGSHRSHTTATVRNNC